MARVLLVALLLLALFLASASAVALYESGNYCTDVSYDTCGLAFSFTALEAGGTFTFALDPTLAASIKSVSSDKNACTLNGSTLSINSNVLQAQGLAAKDKKPVTAVCNLSLTDGTESLSFQTTGGLTIPTIIYYATPFQLVPLDPNCTNPLSATPCVGNLVFPTKALPFSIHTTSTISIDAPNCFDYVTRRRLENVRDYFSVTPDQDSMGQLVHIYTFNRMAGWNTFDAVICTSAVTKEVVSPVFYFTKALDPANPSNRMVLFRSLTVIYSDLQVHTGDDCDDASTNVCTMIYEFSKQIPSVRDLRVAIPGFAEALSSVFECPTDYLETQTTHLTVDAESRVYYCQRWRIHLQVVANTQIVRTDGVGVEIPTAAVTSNQISFSGEYFHSTHYFNTLGIKYTTPFQLEFTNCNDDSILVCTMIIRSQYTGPRLRISINTPYSGFVESTSCSEFMSFREGILSLPSEKSSSQFTMFPRDWALRRIEAGISIDPDSDDYKYHYCHVNIVREIQRTYPTTPIQIDRFSEAGTRVRSNYFLLKESVFTAPAITVPLDRPRADFTLGANCVSATSQWCTLTISPVGATGTLSSMSLSFLGIVADLTPADYKFEAKNPELNRGIVTMAVESYDFQSATVTETVWMFTISIIGSVTQPVEIQFRKILGAEVKGDAFYQYSYGGLRLADRIGSSEYSDDANIQDTVLISFVPGVGTSFSNSCNDPDVTSCVVTVSRASSTIQAAYLSFNGEFIGAVADLSFHSMTQIPVYDQNFNEIMLWKLNYEALAADVNSIRMTLIKRLGARGSLQSISYTPTTVTHPVSNEQVLQINTAEAMTFQAKVAMTGLDGFPTFANNCSDPASEMCSVSYKFKSDVGLNIYDTTYEPLTLVSHWMYGSTQVFHQRLFSCSGPNYVACTAENPAPGCSTITFAQTHPANSPNYVNTVTLTAGRISGGVTCSLTIVKKYTLTVPDRLREFPIALYGQTSFGLASATTHRVVIPQLHWTSLLISADPNCVTQIDNAVVTCTIWATFFGSQSAPIKVLSQTLPAVIFHPFIPAGNVWDLWDDPNSSDRTQLGHLSIQYVTSGMDVQGVDNDNAMAVQQTQQPPRILELAVYEPCWYRTCKMGFILKSVLDRGSYPVAALTVPLFYNGQAPTALSASNVNMPFLSFPATLSGSIMGVAMNTTRVGTNRDVRVEYRFDQPITAVKMDTSFHLRTLDQKIPCYRMDSDHFTQYISKADYDNRLENDQYKISAWVSLDPTDKTKSILTAVDADQLAESRCYTFVTITNFMRTDKVLHTIIHKTLGAFYYRVSYPTYTQTSQLLLPTP